MDYEKVQKWVQRAVGKNETRPAITKAAYLEGEGITVATDGFRVHIAKGAFAPPPEPEHTPTMQWMSQEVRNKASISKAEGIWHVDGWGLSVAVEALKFAAKAIDCPLPAVQVLMEPGRLTIKPDLSFEARFSIDFPGRVEADQPGAIEVNAKYLADALNGMAARGESVSLRLRMPPVEKPSLEAVLQVSREDGLLEAFILPVKSRAYELRAAAAKKNEAVAV